MRGKQSYKTKYRGKILYISSQKNKKSKESFMDAFDFLVQMGLMGQPLFSFCGLPHFYLPILIYVEIKSWANIAIKLDNVIHINKSGVIGCSPLLLFLFIVVVTYLFFQQGYFDKIFLLFVAKSPQKVDLSMFFYC